MEIQSELGLRIRYYRKQRGLSQEKLAELCSLHPTYIGQIERGEKNATIESLYHIAKGLNISLGELLTHLGDLLSPSEYIPQNDASFTGKTGAALLHYRCCFIFFRNLKYDSS